MGRHSSDCDPETHPPAVSSLNAPENYSLRKARSVLRMTPMNSSPSSAAEKTGGSGSTRQQHQNASVTSTTSSSDRTSLNPNDSDTQAIRAAVKAAGIAGSARSPQATTRR